MKWIFHVERHLERGEIGFRPDWMPDGEAFSGQSVPHDILEHSRKDYGNAECEYMATGAYVLIRSQNGMGHQFMPEFKNIGGVICEVLVAIHDPYCRGEPQPFKLPPSTRPIRDAKVEALLAQAATEGVRQYIVNHHDDLEDSDYYTESVRRQDAANALGWMRIGYRRAVRRYARYDTWDIAHGIFERLKRRVEELEHDAEEGQFLVVHTHLAQGRFTADLSYTHNRPAYV